MGNSLSSLLRAMMTRCSCYSRPWPVPLAKFGKLAGSSDDDTLLALVSPMASALRPTLSLSARDIPSPRPENSMASHGGADVIIVSDGNAFQLRNTP